MEDIVIIEPAFLNQFQCVGSACIDHCCKGWEIELDEPTVTRYMTSENIEIRHIAAEKIVTTQASHTSWGKILRQSNGNCAFLDKDRLCKVHKTLGEKSLSTTCALYPRIYASYKYEIRSNLTLSCPEAARLLLTTPDAMLFSEKIKQNPHALDSPEIFQEDRLLNLMCSHIINSCDENIEEGLYGIIKLIQYREEILEGDGFVENLMVYFEGVQDAIKNGVIRRQVEDLPTDYHLQSNLLLHLQKYLGTKEEGRGGNILLTYVQKLNLLHKDEDSGANTAVQSFQQLNKIWHEKAASWLRERHFLLSNYMQYRIYEDFFPFKKGRSPISNLHFLLSEWFLLKCLITASVELDTSMEEADVINIIYSYHSVTRHDKNAEDLLLAEVNKSNFSHGLNLLCILK
ncbi:flagellin lysine-N-methylase [Pantoea rwandensis]|uniref:Lysine-N-methylase n=1 Tax=Pantoea rwandensis TaxID=1076550 RepID=A0A1X1D507_9GAMM|nr:flagellin lysine-N-methylase [Pantoea rwandensis]ORM71765.1 hypothetical protein HA51_01455 [Pantoea rwandensis]